jgi:hypothetical protein
MRHESTSLRPSFPYFVGIISTVMLPFWPLLILVDLLHLRPKGAAPLDYLGIGGLFWGVSVLGAAPSLFFRLDFAEQALHFRWFGRSTLVLRYASITSFTFPVFSYGGLRLNLHNGRRDVYWVDLSKAAAMLRQHGVPQSGVA